jgi:hypothetical protein
MFLHFIVTYCTLQISKNFSFVFLMCADYCNPVILVEVSSCATVFIIVTYMEFSAVFLVLNYIF